MKNEIAQYQSDELPERIEVRLDDDTVWLNQEQLFSTLPKRPIRYFQAYSKYF
jgi:hypothetical protein